MSDVNQTLQNAMCWFCSRPGDAGRKLFAGSDATRIPATVFICSECVEVCIEAFATDDPVWRERQVARLSQLESEEDGRPD